MHAARLRSLFVLVVGDLLLLFAYGPTATSQHISATAASPTNSTPILSSKRRPATEHEVLAPFWILEPGWGTQLEVSNNLAQEDLVVTPVLRTFDGADVPLSPMKIPHDQARAVDLQTLVPDLNGRANSYGSVVFRYKSVSRNNLFATVLLQRLGQPISFHFDAFPVDPDFVSGSRESIWWLPHPTADGFLVITNFSGTSVKVRQVFTEGQKNDITLITLGPHQTRRVSLRDAVQHAGFKTTQGGLRVEFDGDAGSLHVSEFLFDEDSGFSALMKVFERDPKATRDTITLRAPLVGLAVPDPLLGYPDGTVLNPRLFLRNATQDPLPAEFTLSWKSQTSSGRIPVKLPTLAPQETRVLDLSTLQKQGLPPDANWANVAIIYGGRPGDLVPVAASYDDTTRYGLQSPFSDNVSYKWKGGMWHVDAQHNSLITTGNAGTKDARVSIKLFYENGIYEMPERNLKAGEQIWVDVGQLIRNQVPDKKNQVLPLDTMSGSYEIEDLNDSNIGYLYEGKLVTDKTFGHAIYGCAACCGFDSTYLAPDPLGVPVGGGDGFQVWATDACTGLDSQKFGAYNWSSSHTPIATVNQSGYMTGVSAGTTSVATFISLKHPGVNNCPPLVFDPYGPGTVCPLPTTETTVVAGTAASKGFPIVTEFNQAISDVKGDSFDNKTVAEQGGAGSNACYWNGNAIGLVQYPTVSGGVWTVAGNDVPGQHNHWGFDNVGFAGSGAPSYIRANGPAHGVSIPCTASIPQDMVISCDANTNFNYKSDILTITVNSAATVTNCRAGVCQTISAP